jgi:hypothetical protein
MVGLIEEHRAALVALCRQSRVARLEVFGSAATGQDFGAESDVDFLVEFQPLEPGEHARCYLGLLVDLQDLFGRHVDLVETGAIRNPYFLEAVNETRTVLYAA